MRFTIEDAKKQLKRIGCDIDKLEFSLSDFAYGMNVELEHGTELGKDTNVTNNDPLKTAKITLAHMKESPLYYKELKKMESKLEKNAGLVDVIKRDPGTAINLAVIGGLTALTAGIVAKSGVDNAISKGDIKNYSENFDDMSYADRLRSVRLNTETAFGDRLSDDDKLKVKVSSGGGNYNVRANLKNKYLGNVTSGSANFTIGRYPNGPERRGYNALVRLTDKAKGHGYGTIIENAFSEAQAMSGATGTHLTPAWDGPVVWTKPKFGYSLSEESAESLKQPYKDWCSDKGIEYKDPKTSMHEMDPEFFAHISDNGMDYFDFDDEGEDISIPFLELEKKLPKMAPARPSYLKEKYLEKNAALNPDVELNPLQQRVVANPSNRMVLAHGVGSGKTLSSIAKFEKMKQEGKANKALVVVPAGLRNNFLEEGVQKFTDSTANVIGTKSEISKGIAGMPNPDKDYNIISYEMFRKNPEEILQSIGADTVIADENHKLKNSGTSTLDSFNRIKGQYNNYIGLTGSVVSNKISDLYNLVDLASNGEHGLGETKTEFERTYLQRSKDKKYAGVKEEKIPVVGFKHKNQLKGELKKYIDYAGYEDVKDIAQMPNKHVKIKKVPLSHQQAKTYKQLLEDNPDLRKLITNKRLETFGDDQIAQAFNKMIEARKLMNSQGSVIPGMSLAESAKKSTKTRTLLDDMEKHLGKTSDGQAIILSNMINGGIDVLEAGLKDRGYEYGKFIGKGNPGVTEETRQQDVRDFNDRKKRIMLISGAGAEGLSLGDTTWEGVLDGHYNPERMNQMEARGIRSHGLSHRAKEDRNVAVNRYIATMPRKFGIIKSQYKTPDEIIYEIADNKDKQNQLLFKLLRENNK